MNVVDALKRSAKEKVRDTMGVCDRNERMVFLRSDWGTIERSANDWTLTEMRSEEI